MRVYLTGFMGAGKSAVGRELAALLGLPFIDLDAEIEARSGATVRELFARHGEAHFRELEHACLRATAEHPRVVVATGGGTIAAPRNREVMGRLGVSVWIHPAFATIVERIGGRGKEDRPLFQDEAQALALYRQRLVAYRSADLTVDVERGETASEVAARIALLLRERRCVT